LHERAKVVRDALDGHGPSANSLCRFDCLIWAEKAQRSSFDSESETTEPRRPRDATRVAWVNPNVLYEAAR
jgi:hypothetical protein